MSWRGRGWNNERGLEQGVETILGRHRVRGFSLTPNFGVENGSKVELMEKNDWHQPGSFALSLWIKQDEGAVNFSLHGRPQKKLVVYQYCPQQRQLVGSCQACLCRHKEYLQSHRKEIRPKPESSCSSAAPQKCCWWQMAAGNSPQRRVGLSEQKLFQEASKQRRLMLLCGRVKNQTNPLIF